MPESDIPKLIADILVVVELGPHKNKPSKALSGGMKVCSAHDAITTVTAATAVTAVATAATTITAVTTTATEEAMHESEFDW